MPAPTPPKVSNMTQRKDSVGPQPDSSQQPSGIALPGFDHLLAAHRKNLKPGQGIWWNDDPPVARPRAQLTAFELADQEAQRAAAFVMPDRIDTEEWHAAHASPYCIVDNWFFEDVGVFIAPGGTGKTTLVLFEAIHIVLRRPLFGHQIINDGPVLFLTAEDSREMLVARLKLIARQMNLGEVELQRIRDNVFIADLSGSGFRLTTVKKDVVIPHAAVDNLIRAAADLHPAIIFIDPAVSFGVGESRVNDAEQGLIEAGRKIRNALKCGVIYIHHTGKQAARSSSTDQYAGRGGSAFADGSRMVHVLQSLEPDKWLDATGDELKPGDVGLILARPKVSHAPPQPDLFIKRRGYLFERYDHMEGHNAVLLANAHKIWTLLREQVKEGYFPTGRSIEPIAREQGMNQKAIRDAVEWLKSTQQVMESPMTTGSQGGARKYLRPIDPPVTTP